MRWLARGEEHLPPDLAWLTPAETSQVDQLRFTKRRNEFLVRRLAAKHAMAAVLGLSDLQRIEIGHTPDGAPMAFVDGRPASANISVTDRAGWAVCLVGNEIVGCDLELVEPRTPAFVRDYLTPAEQADVAAAPDPDVTANLIWSAKESVLKVLHTGLRRDTRSVEVTVYSGQSSDWNPLTVNAVEGRRFSGWWRRDGQFLFTVAAENPIAEPVALEDPLVLQTATPVHSWLKGPSRVPKR